MYVMPVHNCGSNEKTVEGKVVLGRILNAGT